MAHPHAGNDPRKARSVGKSVPSVNTKTDTQKLGRTNDGSCQPPPGCKGSYHEWRSLPGTDHAPCPAGGSTENTGPSKTPLGIGGAIKAMETRVILEALERNRKNPLAAARELGMHQSSFSRKINSLDIALPRKDGRARSRLQ